VYFISLQLTSGDPAQAGGEFLDSLKATIVVNCYFDVVFSKRLDCEHREQSVQGWRDST
jgi:hypothetical protein